MSDNLLQTFLDRFPADKSRTFLIERDGTERSFAWLLDRTGRYAAVLAAHGVVKGDRVAAQVDKSSDVIALYLACLQLGAIHLPLNTAYTGDEIAYFLGDAAPRVFVCRPAHIDAAKELGDKNDVAAVLSLGSNGDGSRERHRHDRHCGRRQGRRCRNPLHIGHDGPVQGCDADP